MAGVVAQVTSSLFSKLQVQNCVELATRVQMGNDDPMKQTIMIGILPVKCTLSGESIKQPLTFDVVFSRVHRHIVHISDGNKSALQNEFCTYKRITTNEIKSSGHKSFDRSFKRNDDSNTVRRQTEKTPDKHGTSDENSCANMFTLLS